MIKSKARLSARQARIHKQIPNGKSQSSNIFFRNWNLGFSFLFGIWIFGFGISLSAEAATLNVNSCSDTDIKTAIASAADGDTIFISQSGLSCTWSEFVSIPNTRGITIDGNGASITGKIYLGQNAMTPSRITRFQFNTIVVSSVSSDICVRGSKASAPFRIDHCTFTSTAGGCILIEFFGNAPGLLDHNIFIAPRNSEIIHNMGMGSSDDSGWHDDILPGSWNAIYLEDNSFTNNGVSGDPAYFFGNSAIQGYYGCRTVFRNNQLNMSQIDMHGGSLPGARWWEIYSNTWYTVTNGNQDKYINTRAGSGVIFDNHKTGPTNMGSGLIDLMYLTGDNPAYRTGRGKNLTLDPAYIWGNDATMRVTGGSDVVLNTDYYLSQKLGYAALTYPYPLTATGLPNPTGGSSISTHHPADNNPQDGKISANEATTYGACWKSAPATPTGCPTGTAIATMDNAVRAGTLWSSSVNGIYHYNAGAACPLCWEAGP